MEWTIYYVIFLEGVYYVLYMKNKVFTYPLIFFYGVYIVVPSSLVYEIEFMYVVINWVLSCYMHDLIRRHVNWIRIKMMIHRLYYILQEEVVLVQHNHAFFSWPHVLYSLTSSTTFSTSFTCVLSMYKVKPTRNGKKCYSLFMSKL